MKIMKKRLLILLFALAAAVCLGVGLAACGDSSSESGDNVADVPSQSTETEAGTSSSTTKQAPVYQGMVISSANSASTLSSEETVKSYAAMGGTADPSPSSEATGALTGDVNIEGVDIDTQIHLGGDDEPTIEDEITAQFGVTGTGQSIYYADPGDEILITVKFSNPDDYQILSFRINGKTYASYMFQDGSDMENIIVKLDVGTKIGFADFTIDEIKYIDGTEIKDVMLNGETSVRCGIRTDDIPYATVIEETAGIDTITLNIRIIDLYGLIEASDGYCFIALYDGDTMVVYDEYLHEGYNEIVFTGLDANTVYEYAVVAIYDNLSGDGENSINYLTENCLRTEAVVLFDGVEVTKTGVSFSYLWYEGYEYAEIHKLSLESENDTRLTLIANNTTEITGLLSNTRYTLTASYTGPDGSVGSIHMSFTTLAMETPEITINSVSATKTDITYSVTVIDEDTTGYVSSVAVVKDGSVVKGGLLLSGTVSGLLSNNEYTLVVTYAYDLNDGYGERTMEVTANVTTEAMTAPEFEIYTLSSTKEEISYVLYIEDADEAGYLFSVELHMGKMLAGTLFASDGVFENLYSDTEYTIRAEYVYDLNDGYGARTITLTETVSTKAKAVPIVSIDSLTSSKTGIGYGLYVYDADGVGYISSVTLTRGTTVLTGEASETGTFDGLLSGNEYTLNVVYTYDLNDGTGEHTLELSKAVSTVAMASPVFSVEYLKATKDGISYELYVSDTDGVGEITSVTLSKGSKTYTGSDTVGEFTDLLSDNEYTFTAVYTYNLNDGEGEKTIIITQQVSTLAKVTPSISLESLSSTKTGVSYELYVSDADEVGEMTSVTLTRGSRTYTSEGYTGEFNGLYSDNEYTFTAVYTYDLNDGAGERTIVLTKTISTKAMEAPVFEISSLTSTKEDISYALYIGDADETGYLFSVELHMGRMLVTTTPDEWGTFVGLYSDTEYTITAEYVYDLNDGEGARNIKITETIFTKAKETPIVTMDTLTATKTGIDYSLAITDADGVGEVTSVVLAKGAAVISSGTAVSGSYTGLLSDNEYTLTVTYTYDLNDGTGEKTIILSETITTEATATPKLVIYTLTSTTEDITYELIETDKDEVGEIVSIELFQGAKLICSTADELGTFEGLLSDNEYTLVVTYAYDLNDGLGTRTTEVSGTVSTKAKKTPTVEIYNLMSGKEDITYELAIGDEEGVGYIYSLTLSRGSLSWTVDPFEYGTFTNLLSDNEYTLTVVYVYDLNDGNGEHTINVTGTVSTLAKETPEVDIYSLTSTKNSVDYELIVTDTDGVGEIVSVTLTKGNTVYTADADVCGSFEGLLSDNEYTLVIVYGYNLNDGYGTHTFEISKKINTIAASLPQVNINSLAASKEGIDYALSVNDEDDVITGISVTLVKGEDVVGSAATVSGEFDGLLSGNEYTITVMYTYDLWDGQGEKTIEMSTAVATVAKELPNVTIDSLTSTKEGVAYEYSVTDADGVGLDVSVSLSGVGVTYEGSLLSGEFDGLLSDNEYTLSVCVTYDLNDGNGEQIIEFAETIKTVAKDTPVAEIVYIDSSTSELTFCVLYADGDAVGSIVNVGLYSGDALVEDTGCAYTGEISYTGLSSYTRYTLVVSFEYDLNDGVGTRYASSELSYYTDPLIEFTSVSVINSSAVMEGETVVIEAEMYNPDGVTFEKVIINDETYDASSISYEGHLFVEIVNDGQFEGGDTDFTITEIICSIGGNTYNVYIESDNTASIFINGELLVEDFTIVRIDEYGREEETEYAFKTEQLYYKIILKNKTGYNIYSVTIGSTVYSGDKLTLSDDGQTLYVAMSDTSTGAWYTRTLSGISYGNSDIDKEKYFDYTAAYVRLKSDDIIEISEPSQLLEMNGWKYYKLVNNIDLSGSEWVNMDNYMYGVFDGNGYTISGLGSITTYYDSELNLGLFYNAQGIVKNLTICDVLYYVFLDNTTETSYYVYAGALSARSGRLTVENCQFSSSFQITNYGKGYIYIGSVSGNGSSNSKLSNVVTDLNAEIDYVTGYYFNGYFGNSLTVEIIDSTCHDVLTKKTDGTKYFIEDELKFSYSDGIYSLVGYLGSDTSIVLPETYNGYPYAIGYEAFRNNTTLVDIVLPEGLLYIDEYAFYGCTSLTYVNIPESVESIGKYAFYNCKALIRIDYNAESLEDLSSSNYVFAYAGQSGGGIVVTIGSSVKSIPAYLFCPYSSNTSYAPNIVSVVLETGSQCEEIGLDAFYKCSSLSGVYITDIEWWCGLTFKSEYSNPLYYAGNLYLNGELVRDLVIPDSITSVNKYAFCNCTSLTSISIPESVSEIGTYAFYNCTMVTDIYFNAECMEDLSSYNCVFCYVGRDSFGVTISIGPAVRRIPTYIFDPYGGTSYAPKIVNIIYDVNCQCSEIGIYAFAYCSELTSALVPDGVEQIGSYAFYNCKSLTSIVISETVQQIGNYAFYNCVALTEINYNAKSAEDLTRTNYVFAYAGQDGDGIILTIGASVEYIPAYMFSPYDNTSYAANIVELQFESGSRCTSIEKYAFAYCTSLESVTIPESMKTFGNYAFYNCTAIEKIHYNAKSAEDLMGGNDVFRYAGQNGGGITLIIGASVEYIPTYMFSPENNSSDYANIVEVQFESGSECTSIGEYAFCYCVSLESIDLPDSIISIGRYAFYYCTSLKTLNFSEGINAIADYAFYNCTSLKTLNIPESVESIGNYAFYNCTALEEIYFNAVEMDDLSSSNNVFYYGGKKGDGITVTIGSSVKSVPAYLFYPGSSSYVPNIKNVIFEDGSQCRGIGDHAFYYCDQLAYVELGSSITSIQTGAFAYCSSLTSITIPSTVITIGTEAFYMCYNLIEVYNYSVLPITPGSTACGYVGYYAAAVYNSYVGDRFITTDDGFRFYFDGESYYLFQYVGDETELVLPSSINGCEYSIYNYAFYYDKSIVSVTMPDTVTSIGDYAFYYCSSLKYINMSEGLTYIGEYAFGYCSSLKSVSVPKNVATIGNYAFRDCTGLEEIYYDAENLGNLSSGNNVFYNAGSKGNGITVIIGADVKSIPNYLFYVSSTSYPVRIVSVIFEDGCECESIGQYAFGYCGSLTSIVIPASVTSIGNYAFYDCYSLIFVYYEGMPEDWNSISIGSNNSYLTDATIYYYSETQPTDTDYTYWHYVDGEVVLW